MGYVSDGFKGDLFHEHPIKQVTSDPASAKEGSLIINTSTNIMKVYYGGAWQTLHSLGADTPYFFLLEDGFNFLQEDGTSKLQLES